MIVEVTDASAKRTLCFWLYLIAGTDYIALGNTKLIFNPGDTSKTFRVTIKAGTLDEADEKFNLIISSPTHATIGTGMGTRIGTILDDDATPKLSINDVSLAEGNSGSKSFVFTVTLSAFSGRPVSASFTTRDGTATQGTDNINLIGPLNFAAGTTTKTISVSVKGDSVVEKDEQFKVTLSSPTNAALGDALGLGTILNDEVIVKAADRTSAPSYRYSQEKNESPRLGLAGGFCSF